MTEGSVTFCHTTSCPGKDSYLQKNFSWALQVALTLLTLRRHLKVASHHSPGYLGATNFVRGVGKGKDCRLSMDISYFSLLSLNIGLDLSNTILVVLKNNLW